MMLRSLPLRTRPYCLERCLATFVDPFGAKDPQLNTVRDSDLQDHNRLAGYSNIVGDPKKGLADDTSVHPFGDLRINLARFTSSNLCFWWEYDFTGGQILNNAQNALLSNNSKNRIYTLHMNDPEKWSVERLADEYRIRKQRVMAILSLKERAAEEMGMSDEKRQKYKDMKPPQVLVVREEEAVEDAGENTEETAKDAKTKREISDNDWYNLCDWAEQHVFRATAEKGSGERHFVSVPTYPKFEEIPLDEAEQYANTEWNISRVNRMYTVKEDKFQIREFQERLLLNTGKMGATLDFETDRKKMHRSPPKHDSPILITSLDEDIIRPYVAEPDGTQRRLTPDEFLIWKRKNREAFTKLVEKQIQREGKRDNTQ